MNSKKHFEKLFFSIILIFAVFINAEISVKADDVSDFTELQSALVSATTINLQDNITATADLNNVGQSMVSFYGNNFSIDGNSHKGTYISSGHTLNVTNVGNIADPSISKGFFNFSSSSGGSVFANSGNLSIANTVFDNNTISNGNGGVISNTAGGRITSIEDAIFNHNSNTVASGQGGAIFNSGYNGSSIIDIITNVLFSNNSADYGGAIANNNSGEETGTITTIDATFTGNFANQGGAIYNTGTITKIDATFTGNSANQGGAIANNYGVIEEIAGTYTNNTATSHGGVVFNNGDADTKITKMSGTYSGNSATNGVGGVLYLARGAVEDLSGTFTNNTANNSEGGAIYSNANTILNITTTSGNTLFSGNTDASGSNAIRNGGTVNMNAGEGKTITFDDKITGGGSGAKAININDSTVKSDMTTGSVIFNNTVSGNAVTLNAGTMKLGIANALASATSLTLNGGTIDLQDDAINNQNLGTITLNADTYLKIDANLAGSTPVADVISGTISNTSTTNRIKINAINVLSDFTTDTYTTQVASDGLKAYVALATSPLSINGKASGVSYLVTYDNTTGYLTYGYGDLATAVKLAVASKSYTMAANETAPTGGYGDLAGTSLTINGDSTYSVDGNSQAGINVASGQTLTVNNVVSMENFSKDSSGAAIKNDAGTVVITNTPFSNNTAVTSAANSIKGGAIYNDNAGSLTITGSDFTENYVESALEALGGAIYNGNGSSLSVTGDFTNNSASAVSAYGGAIANDIGSEISSIVGDFSNNYTDGTNSYGGAIYNAGGSTITNITGDFDTNVAKGTNAGGGAIANLGSSSVLTVTDSSFTNNASSGNGGAITNSGILNIIAKTKDVLFSGNKKNATISISGARVITVDGGTANDIYNTSTVNLNADTNKKITFGGTIEGSGGTININSGSVNKDGTVVFNNTVSGNAVTLNAGTMKLGIANALASATSLTLNGGTVDLQDDAINNQNLGTITLNADTYLKIDANLAGSTPVADVISGTISNALTTNKIKINAINVLSDFTSDTYTTQVASDGLKAYVALATSPLNIEGKASGVSYLVTYDNTTGYLSYGYGDLYTAVKSEVADKSYTMAANETAPTGGYGALNGTSLTINGDGHSVNGNSQVGINVAAGKTLTINNVGINTSGVVQGDGFNNFSKTGDGAAISNAGNMSVTDTVFKSNAATNGGGAIFNSGTITNIGSGSVFTSNSATKFGGAIFNSAGNIGTINGTYTKNTAGTEGGAIVNTGSITNITGTFGSDDAADGNTAGRGGAIANFNKITTINATFKKNRATGSGSTVRGGGAILNSGNGSSITTINGTFEGNQADRGGAISNYTSGTSTSISTIDATFTGNSATTEGGAIYNNETITTINGTFGGDNAADGNTAGRGGVLANFKTIGTISGIFKNNRATSSHGGVIYNGGSSSQITTVSGTFTNNTANSNGGAIYNTSSNNSTKITKIDGTFTSNSANQGGAIANEFGVIEEIAGTYTGNTATTNGGVVYTYGNADTKIQKMSGTYTGNTATSGVGGVMYLARGAVEDLSGTFTNNTATASGKEGGAIYSNQDTILNITTTTGNTLFSGNTDSTGSNAIRNGGTVNMNAGEGRTITFDDKITGGGGGARTININDSSVKSDMTTGTVIFNNTVSGNRVTLNAGTMKLGIANALASAISLTLNGGTIDLQDDAINNQNLGTITLNADTYLKIDANLAGSTPVADVISGTISNTTTTNKLTINSINVLSDFTTDTYTTQVANDGLKGYVQLVTTPMSINGKASGVSYLVTYDNTTGYLSYGYGDLYTAVKSEVADKSYTMAANETAPTGGYGNLNGTSLTINGDGHSVNGNSQAGINVAAGKTLTINNVGIDTSGVVQGDGFNNFSKTGNGAAIDNAGTMKILSSIFKSNTATTAGGAISNTGTIGDNTDETTRAITAISGTFDSNSSANGGAIYNAGTGVITRIGTNTAADTTFTENTATSKGGAIRNDGTIYSMNANFTENSATGTGGAIHNVGTIGDNTDDTTRAITAISGTFDSNSSANGGAIYNAGTSSLITRIGTDTIADTVFTGNNVTSSGGAIRNEGSIFKIGSTFTNNTAAYGGAISNDGTINLLQSNFTGNTATGGGAIYNRGVIGDNTDDITRAITAISGTYASNSANNGGAIYNANVGTTGIITRIGTNTTNDTVFTENSATGSGGAIRNEGIIYSINANFNQNTATTNGGAIYNDGTISDLSGTFSNNTANSNGGAIYNNTGKTVNITTTGGSTTFSGNTKGAVGSKVSNAIHNLGIINMNAGEGKSITFNDAISGSSGTININDSTVKSTMLGGSYIFNNTVSGNSINLYGNGTITIGSGGNLSLNAFTNDANGGSINFSEGAYKAANLGVTTLGSVLQAAIDVSADGLSADTIAVGSGSTGTIQLTSLGAGAYSGVSSAAATEISNQILLGSDGNTSLSLTAALIAAYAYEAVDDTTTGTDTFTGTVINVNDKYGDYTQDVKTTKGISITDSTPGVHDTLTYTITKTPVGEKSYDPLGDNLNIINVSPINDGDGNRFFEFNNATETYTLTQNSGTTAAGTLNVNGVYDSATKKRSTIAAAGKTLFTITNTGTVVKLKDVKIDNVANLATDVAAGNTLKLSNTEVVKNAATTNSAITNHGNTIIEDSTITSNIYESSYINGGAVNSAGKLYVSGSRFQTAKNDNLKKKHSARDGGALRITGGNATIKNTTFAPSDTSLYSSSGARNGGGAIDVQSGGEVFVDKSAFDGNFAGYQGGAISIASGAKVTVQDSVFQNNSLRTNSADTSNRGGAIYNAGTLNVIANTQNTTFENNYYYSEAHKNSIYNTGTVNLNALNTTYNVVINDPILGSDGTININDAITYNYLVKGADDSLTVTPNSITSSVGKVVFGANVSGNNVNVKAGTLENTATLTAATSVTNAGTITNSGTISATNLTNTNSISNTATITATNLANSGAITGATGSLTMSGTSTNNGTGTGAGINQATVSNSGTLTNSAALTATSSLTNTNSIVNTSTITATNLANSGAITGAGSLTIAGTSTNNGTGTGAGITQTSVTNNGTLTNSAPITATTFTNTGSVTNTATNANITATNVINTSTGSLTTAVTKLVNTNAIQNDGTLTLSGTGSIAAGITKYTTGGGTVDIQAGTSSTITLNDSIEDNIIKLTSGTLKLDNNTGSADVTSATKILANGGELSIQDDKLNSVALGNIDLTTNSIKLSIDADLTKTTADTRADIISGTVSGSTTNKVLINNIKLVSDAGHETEMDIKVADSSIKANVDLGPDVTISGTDIGSFLLSYNSSTGNIHAEHSDLLNAITSTITTKAYVLADTDLNITADLPALGGTSLSITGGSKTLTGNDHSGFVLANSGQTLSISDLTINDFTTAINNSVGGTVNLKNVTFGSDNTTAVNNAGTMGLSGTTNTFNAAVTGTGTTTVSEGTTNINTAFAQSKMTIADGAGVVANADNLTISDTTTGLENNGTLTLTGGTNNNVITSTKAAGGNINLTGAVTNAGSISSNNISATTNNFSNTNTITGGSVSSTSGNISNSGSMTGLTSISSTSGNLNLAKGSTTSATDVSLGTGTLSITDTAALTTTNPVSITSGHVIINAATTDSALTSAITGSYDINTSSLGTTTATIDAAISGATSITAAAGSNLKLTQNATSSTSVGINAGTNGTVTLSNTGTTDSTVSSNITGTNYDLSVENTSGKKTLVASTVSGANKIDVNSGTMAINDSSNIGTAPVYLNSTSDFEINTAKTGYTVSNNIIGTDKSQNDVTLKGAANTTFSLGSSISDSNVLLSSGTLYLPNQDNLTNSALTIASGATLDTINSAIYAYTDATFKNNAQLEADVDAFTSAADNFIGVTQEGSVVLTDINIMNADKIVQNSKTIDLAKSMGLSSLSVSSELQGKEFPVMTPIRRMSGSLSSDGKLTFAPTGDGYDDFNPAIMSSPVAAQMGGYLVQLNSYDEAFRNMDMFMLMPKAERKALRLNNRYASADNNIVYNPTLSIYDNKSAWFRPYATFESVPLKNGPRVSNVMYGSFFGGDSKMYDIGRGWEGMFSAYVGYNGSHQTYNGISIYQNGGTLGLVGMAYKGNFFTGLTINTGASAGNANTMYGNEDFAMLMAGVASKTGYNFEFAKGKFIVQPNYLMSYSFINTFDYTNAAGVRIDSDPLHAVQIEPGIKFIGNLKNGWQPYASVNVVWNIIDKMNVMANDVSLPSVSVRPFVKYGVGVRKTWGERFTGFFQTYITNGGRNGVGLQSGFQWVIGDTPKTTKETSLEDKKIKKTSDKNIVQKKQKQTTTKKKEITKTDKNTVKKPVKVDAPKTEAPKVNIQNIKKINNFVEIKPVRIK